MLTGRGFFLAAILLLVCTVSALSQEVGLQKSVKQKAPNSEKLQQSPASPPSPKSEAVRTQEDQPVSHTAEKLETDRQLVEYTRQLAWFTCALVVATVVLGCVSYWQGRSIKRTVDLAREEFVATHRPKIIVRRVSLDPVKGIGIPDSQKIQFIIANVGRTKATICKLNATLWDSKGADTLPAIPPYGDITQLNNMELKPGTSFPYPLHFDEKLEAQINFQDGFGAETSIYLLGYILYRDELNGQYHTAFCRRYNAGKQRFIEVEDPAYEYQD